MQCDCMKRQSKAVSGCEESGNSPGPSEGENAFTQVENAST